MYVCMYACMYVCMCVYIYIHTCICMYVSMHVFLRVCYHAHAAFTCMSDIFCILHEEQKLHGLSLLTVVLATVPCAHFFFLMAEKKSTFDSSFEPIAELAAEEGILLLDAFPTMGFQSRLLCLLVFEHIDVCC